MNKRFGLALLQGLGALFIVFVVNAFSASQAHATINDPSLSSASTIKGETISSLGTPDADPVLAIAGSVNIPITSARDSGVLGTTFTTADPGGFFLGVAKYPSGTTDFSTYNNGWPFYQDSDEIKDGDIFLINTRAADGLTETFYQIIANLTPTASSVPDFPTIDSIAFGDPYTGSSQHFIFDNTPGINDNLGIEYSIDGGSTYVNPLNAGVTSALTCQQAPGATNSATYDCTLYGATLPSAQIETRLRYNNGLPSSSGLYVAGSVPSEQSGFDNSIQYSLATLGDIDLTNQLPHSADNAVYLEWTAPLITQRNTFKNAYWVYSLGDTSSWVIADKKPITTAVQDSWLITNNISNTVSQPLYIGYYIPGVGYFPGGAWNYGVYYNYALDFWLFGNNPVAGARVGPINVTGSQNLNSVTDNNSGFWTVEFPLPQLTGTQTATLSLTNNGSDAYLNSFSASFENGLTEDVATDSANPTSCYSLNVNYQSAVDNQQTGIFSSALLGTSASCTFTLIWDNSVSQHLTGPSFISGSFVGVYNGGNAGLHIDISSPAVPPQFPTISSTLFVDGKYYAYFDGSALLADQDLVIQFSPDGGTTFYSESGHAGGFTCNRVGASLVSSTMACYWDNFSATAFTNVGSMWPLMIAYGSQTTSTVGLGTSVVGLSVPTPAYRDSIATNVETIPGSGGATVFFTSPLTTLNELMNNVYYTYSLDNGATWETNIANMAQVNGHETQGVYIPGLTNGNSYSIELAYYVPGSDHPFGAYFDPLDYYCILCDTSGNPTPATVELPVPLSQSTPPGPFTVSVSNSIAYVAKDDAQGAVIMIPANSPGVHTAIVEITNTGGDAYITYFYPSYSTEDRALDQTNPSSCLSLYQFHQNNNEARSLLGSNTSCRVTLNWNSADPGTYPGENIFSIHFQSVGTQANGNRDFLLVYENAAPGITLSRQGITGYPGQLLSGYTINSLGGAVVNYTISPDISTTPANGLSFNTATGMITGTPTAVAGTVTYTITANNLDDSGNPQSSSATIDITVRATPPPAFPTISSTLFSDQDWHIFFDDSAMLSDRALTFEFSIDNGSHWYGIDDQSAGMSCLQVGTSIMGCHWPYRSSDPFSGKNPPWQIDFHYTYVRNSTVASDFGAATRVRDVTDVSYTPLDFYANDFVIIPGDRQATVTFSTPVVIQNSFTQNIYYTFSLDGGTTWNTTIADLTLASNQSTQTIVIPGLTNGSTYDLKLAFYVPGTVFPMDPNFLYDMYGLVTEDASLSNGPYSFTLASTPSVEPSSNDVPGFNISAPTNTELIPPKSVLTPEPVVTTKPTPITTPTPTPSVTPTPKPTPSVTPTPATTPAVTNNNSKSGPLKGKLTLKIYFNLGSYSINSANAQRIKKFSAAIAGLGKRITIDATGYAQPTPGSEATDGLLSKRRAAAVAKLLQSYGVNTAVRYAGAGRAAVNAPTSRYVEIVAANR